MRKNIPNTGGNKNRGPAHNRFKHGMTNTRTYKSWSGMKARCFNAESDDYPNYGGRGITVCDRWMDFANFFADMGEAPPGMTIDRRDNDLGYSPENCRWADKTTQSRNRRYVKLSMEKADAIRAARADGKTFAAIGEEFEIQLSHAHRVANGESWQP